MISVFKILGISEVLGASEVLGSLNMLRCLLMLVSLEVLEPVDAFGLLEMLGASQLLRPCEVLGVSSQEVGATPHPSSWSLPGFGSPSDSWPPPAGAQSLWKNSASIECQDPSPCS